MHPDVTGGLHQIRTEVFLILGDLTAGLTRHRGRGITSAARVAGHHALPPACISDQTLWIRQCTMPHHVNPLDWVGRWPAPDRGGRV